jgi:DNA-binding MarR family transcriptional regulator
LCQDEIVSDQPDRVDHVIEQWRRERPDLDPSAKAVTGRVVRAGDLIRRRMSEALAPLGVRDGDYGLLSALRRAGDPFELSPTELRRHLLITSGGLTLQIERMERSDLVARRPNPDDGRGTLVRLTPHGRDVVDQAMARHADLEHELMAGLSAEEADTLAGLLRKLLRDLDA